MKTLLVGGSILTPDEALADATLVIEEQQIIGIERGFVHPSAEDTIINAKGKWVVPGFIDLHVHGGFGADAMDAAPNAIHQMGRHFAQHGVTSFLATTITASIADTRAAVENIAALSWLPDSAQPLGVHLEGPYLNHDYRGAQPAQHLRIADQQEYGFWLRNKQVRLITVAPEVEGVLELIDAGRRVGIEFAVGHSGATYEKMMIAADHGLNQVTHTFNGMPGLHHRSPGVVGAALTDSRLWAQIIVDGIHVHPVIVNLLVKIKGVDHTILVTDASRAAGMPDGDYALGDQLVHVKDGVARTDSGGLAGSTLTMDQALRNVMEFTNLSLQEALPMATRVPATAMGLAPKKGVLSPNSDADVVLLDDTYRVRLTMVGGRVVYRDF
jgi:N-acetylglucosamine-6-phosphate deacetylase